MTETVAWAVNVGAALLALFCFWALTRPMRGGFLKTWLRCLAAVALLCPAPVPGFSPYYAPAIVVLLFEAVLQRDGEPERAAASLIVGFVVATLLAGGHHVWRRRRGTR